MSVLFNIAIDFRLELQVELLLQSSYILVGNCCGASCTASGRDAGVDYR